VLAASPHCPACKRFFKYAAPEVCPLCGGPIIGAKAAADVRTEKRRAVNDALRRSRVLTA
jgi:rRNA maturation endonuclease Nob1